MFHRVVCLTTIAAVISCPLWCTSGLCGSANCKFDQVAIQPNFCLQSNAESELPACCCKNSPAHQDQHQTPCPCPEKEFCQGVCGGAVFEEPVELDDATLSFFVYLAHAGRMVEPQILDLRQSDVGRFWSNHGSNSGRMLRTLHMSFLL